MGGSVAGRIQDAVKPITERVIGVREVAQDRVSQHSLCP